MSPELSSRVNLALRQWNKLARNKGGAVTLKKTNSRISGVRYMDRALPQLDWSDKDTWKRYFTAVFQIKAELEAKHPSKDFRVTFDWALSRPNVRMVIRTLSGMQLREHKSKAAAA